MSLPTELLALVRRHPSAVEDDLIQRFDAWVEGAHDESMSTLAGWFAEARDWELSMKPTEPPVEDLDTILAALGVLGVLDDSKEEPRYRMKERCQAP